MLLKDPNSPVFDEKWPSMRPTILKLLRQEAVSRAEWHDLFWLVHSVCLWDDKVILFIFSSSKLMFCAGSSKSVQWLERGYSRVYKAGSGASVVSPGGAGAAQGVHCRMEEIFHTMQLSSNAIRPTRDCSSGGTLKYFIMKYFM